MRNNVGEGWREINNNNGSTLEAGDQWRYAGPLPVDRVWSDIPNNWVGCIACNTEYRFRRRTATEKLGGDAPNPIENHGIKPLENQIEAWKKDVRWWSERLKTDGMDIDSIEIPAYEAATISIPKENLWLHEEVIRLEAEAECLRELVRYQRAELQQARIITDEKELAAKGNNSFDLLTFDELKKQVELMEKQIDSDLDSSLKFSKIANEEADRLNKEIESLRQEVERLKGERRLEAEIERRGLTEEDRKHLRWAFGLSEYLHREEMRRDEDAMVFARTVADGLRKIISRMGLEKEGDKR